MRKLCLTCFKPFETEFKENDFCTDACHQLFVQRFFGESSIQLKYPSYRLEQGKAFDLIKKTKRVEQFWIFSHAMLWHTMSFHEGEENKFKKLISEYFKKSKDSDTIFIELVERCCLAKRHIEENPSRYIPLPEDWFNPSCANGLTSTNKWYSALQRQRSFSPEFNKSLNIFAQAVMRYADTHNILDIAFFRQLFISQTHYDLLQWYMNIVMHFQFINH